MKPERARHLALIVIVLPMAVAIIYYSFFAADRYVSEAVVTVRQAGDGGSAVPGLAMMLAGINPPAREEIIYVREYIHTLDLFKHLDADLNLRQVYGDQKKDLLYRLFDGNTQEDALEYFRSRIGVHLDEKAGLLNIRVEAFDPGYAQKVNRTILTQSERFVNEISHRMAREQMAFAENELAKAGERFQQAKSRLIEFQNQNATLDPLAEAQAKSGLAAQLEASLAQHEAELRNMLTYLNPGTPQVVAQRNLIRSISDQLAMEKQRIASPEGQRLNTLAGQYLDLTIEAGIAESAYKLAITAVENARIEASRKLKSLVTIAAPSLPEEAIYPRRLYNLATLFIILCLFYGIVRFAIATIEDHRD